jgi:hypothetical protein
VPIIAVTTSYTTVTNINGPLNSSSVKGTNALSTDLSLTSTVDINYTSTHASSTTQEQII